MKLEIGKLVAKKVTSTAAWDELFGGSVGPGLQAPYYNIFEGGKFLFSVKDLEESPTAFAALVSREARELFIAELRKENGSHVFGY